MLAPGSTTASNGRRDPYIHRASRGWVLGGKLERNLRPPQQSTQRSRLQCRTVEVLLLRQLLLLASGSESRFGRAVVVFVHPTHRQRLDPPREVKLFVHSVLLQLLQVHHARSVAAHEPRRAHVIDGKNGLPIQLWLLQIFRDLRDCCNHVEVVHRIPMARVLFGRGVFGDSPIVTFPSGGPSDLRLGGLTDIFAPGISTADEDIATGVDGNGMPTGDACAPPGSGGVGSSVRGCFAECSSSVARVTSRAPRQQDSPRLSQLLIHLLNLLQQVSAAAHDSHLVSPTVVHSILVHSSSLQPWEHSSRRLRCSQRSPFQVSDGISRPAPVLCQPSSRSRAKHTSFASHNVFVHVTTTVEHQPTGVNMVSAMVTVMTKFFFFRQ